MSVLTSFGEVDSRRRRSHGATDVEIRLRELCLQLPDAYEERRVRGRTSAGGPSTVFPPMLIALVDRPTTVEP